MIIFLSEAIKARAKVLLVGDDSQLQAVGYMGGFVGGAKVGGSYLGETEGSKIDNREATELMTFRIRGSVISSTRQAYGMRGAGGVREAGD